MEKVKLIKLMPGTSITWGGTNLGYSRGGITIGIERLFHRMKNQKYGCDVGAKLTELGALITAPLLEYNSNTDDLIFSATIGVEPSYAEVIIEGGTMEGLVKKFTFYKCYVQSTGEINLTREPGSVFQLVFRAVLNDAGQLYLYTGG